VKGTSEHEVVVGRELAQAWLKFPLVDQTTGLVDNYERENSPVKFKLSVAHSWCFGVERGAHDVRTQRRGRVKVIINGSYCACSISSKK
jgi:hypothetical protein